MIPHGRGASPLTTTLKHAGQEIASSKRRDGVRSSEIAELNGSGTLARAARNSRRPFLQRS